MSRSSANRTLFSIKSSLTLLRSSHCVARAFASDSKVRTARRGGKFVDVAVYDAFDDVIERFVEEQAMVVVGPG